MSERPDDMLSWLRSQILARKATAEAASKGTWKVGETEEYCGALAIVGDDATVTAHPPEIASGGYEGGGVWEREDADHIVLNQPQDTIARCEAELALLADHSDFDFPANDDDGPGGYSWTAHCDGCGQPTPCRTVRLVASGYRHLPGWLPAWAPESP